jgi:hypothetical protein
VSQPYTGIVTGHNGRPCLSFGETTLIPLDEATAPLLLIDLAHWLVSQNVVVGASATMEASAHVFEALGHAGNPEVSREIVTAVNDILAKHNPTNGP